MCDNIEAVIPARGCVMWLPRIDREPAQISARMSAQSRRARLGLLGCRWGIETLPVRRVTADF